jgi:hypothetical protein
MAAEGQANLSKLNRNLFRVANLRLDDEFANFARVRGRRAAVTVGAGTLSDRMQMEAEGETVMGVFLGEILHRCGDRPRGATVLLSAWLGAQSGPTFAPGMKALTIGGLEITGPIPPRYPRAHGGVAAHAEQPCGGVFT